MVANKHISKIIIVLMTAAVAVCILMPFFSGKLMEMLGGAGVKMEYKSKLFDTDKLINIDIRMSEKDWNAMLSNAMSEEYSVCDVVINGEKIKNVAIRPKGNSSLMSVANDQDNDHFSLKLEFDHFVGGQTCYGLDKLILNNNYSDASNMKEALIYDMFRYLDAEASLYNYAKVSVNGEYFGIYLALEAVENSYMLRSFGTQDGELYKPDGKVLDNFGSSNFAKNVDFVTADFSDFDFSALERDENDDGEAIDFDLKDFLGRLGFDFSMFDDFSISGASLDYTDEELESYTAIWAGECTHTGKKDHRRVVTALKNISEGRELEKYLDVDNVLRYMAVHAFSVNMDSLSGDPDKLHFLMEITTNRDFLIGFLAHNYYLYEYNGRLNIIPWDYNLSFGGMTKMLSEDASDMINDAIDTPFPCTKFFDSLLANEEYRERYHTYLRRLVKEYVQGGEFDSFYNRVRGQIDTLLKNDENTSYDYNRYESAAEMLCRTVALRAESIQGQLDGKIPSTDEGQRQNPQALIDASDIDIEVMGEFDMAGFGQFFGSEEDGSDMFASFFGDGVSPEILKNLGNMSDMDTSDIASMFGIEESKLEEFDIEDFYTGDVDFENVFDMGSKFDMENLKLGNIDDEDGSGMGDHAADVEEIRIKNLITFCLCAMVIMVVGIYVNYYKRRRWDE